MPATTRRGWALAFAAHHHALRAADVNVSLLEVGRFVLLTSSDSVGDEES